MHRARLLIPILASTLLLAAGEGEKPAADAYNGFDVSNAIVPAGEIRAGGPGRDGIRSVDEPRFAPAAEATWVAPDTPVIGLVVAEVARGYPVHLMEWHQVVNDEVEGEPVVVTYDPLAGAPRAYRSRVDGRRLGFGVSGLVYNANFLLYDRETESLWSQFDGRAIAGELAGKRLERLRVRQEPVVQWISRHPQTLLLERPERMRIDYRYSPFKTYWVKDEIPFPVKAEDRRFHAKEVVTGVVVDGVARAYLGSKLTAAGGRCDDEVGGVKIHVEYDTNLATFTWKAPEEAQVDESYWFAWKAFHPDTEIWSEGSAD